MSVYWWLVAWWNRPSTWCRTPLRPTRLGWRVFMVFSAASALVVGAALMWALYAVAVSFS